MIDQELIYFKGRVALFAILEAIGISGDDEIILQGFTCLVVPNVITYFGARPVYVDVDRKTYAAIPDQVEQKITSKTRAIIIQNGFGLSPDIDRFKEISDTHNLYLLEDCAHGFGAKYKGQLAGTNVDAAFFSSQWSKPFSTGLGGFCMVNNPEILRRMKDKYNNGYYDPSLVTRFSLHLQYLIREYLLPESFYWSALKLYRFLYSNGLITGSSSPEELAGDMPYNFKMKAGPYQKRLIKRLSGQIEEVIEHRRNIAHQYHSICRGLGIEAPFEPGYAEHSFLRYVILAKDKQRVIDEAVRFGVEIGDWFDCPLHPAGSPLEKLYYSWGMCPNAEYLTERMINLPTHMKIEGRYVEKVGRFLEYCVEKGYI